LRVISWLLALAVACGLWAWAPPAFAGVEPAGESAAIVLDSMETSGEGWSLADNVYTIADGADVVISGTTTTRRIVVAPEATVSVTFAGVSITSSLPPFEMVGATVDLTLADGTTNTLAATGGGSPGMFVPRGATLTIGGEGSLSSQGARFGSGIGGRWDNSNPDLCCGGAITINGGTITATAGDDAAGIGGGRSTYFAADNGSVTINGGLVTATGWDGAGIGGGLSYYSVSNGGAVFINGGIVVAAGSGGGQAIGAGCGSAQGQPASGSISGGAVVYANMAIDTSGGLTIDNAVVFIENEGTIYGDTVMSQDFTIASGQILTVPAETSLTVPEGQSLTNSGLIVNEGTLTMNGTFSGNPVENNGTINGTNGGSVPQNVFYELTVVSGTGSGQYSMGRIVSISADSVSGKQFDRWKGEGGVSIASATAANTTVTMPAGAAKVTATYKTLYTLTIEGGTLSGSTSTTGQYVAGASVNISAGTPVFVRWKADSDDVRFSDPYNADAYFTMPDKDVVISVETGVSHTLTIQDDEGPYTISVPAGKRTVPYDVYGVYIPWQKEFDHWECTAGSFEDPYDMRSAFIMPDSDATITAVLKDRTFYATVLNGTGSGEYPIMENGTWTKVSVKANAAPEGMEFEQWTYIGSDYLGSGSADFDDAQSPETKFVHGSEYDVTVMALFRAKTEATLAANVIDLGVGEPTADTQGTGWHFDVETQTYVIDNGAAVTVVGHTNDFGLKVAEGTALTKITLSSAYIGQETGTAGIDLADAKAEIILIGDNVVYGGYGYSAGFAAIRVPAGAEVTIGGSGSLMASGYGAGIGGDWFWYETPGLDANAGSVTVTGGTVTAIGYDAGIGGGCNEAGGGADGGSFRITGGVVTAISSGWDGAAGIGGGYSTDGDANGGTITIEGGVVNAFSRGNGAAIGGGRSSGGDANGGIITISGGVVNANIGDGPYLDSGWPSNNTGIGGGYSSGGNADGGQIMITGGTVNTRGGSEAGVGIGAGMVYVDSASYQPGAPATGGLNGDVFAFAKQGVDDEWPTTKGVLFVGNEGTVYGDVVVREDVTIPAGYTLTIPEGATLTVAPGVTLTNLGTIVNSGTLVNDGTLAGGGAVTGHAVTKTTGKEDPPKDDGGQTVADENPPLTAGSPSAGVDSADTTPTTTTAKSVTLKKLTIKKLTPGAKKLTVKWTAAPKAQKVTKYQIRYRVKGTKKWRTVNVSAKKTNYSLKKLKSGKRYQVQVRAVRKVTSGANKGTYYGAWSRAKTSRAVK
jgi:hypothetical protein